MGSGIGVFLFYRGFHFLLRKRLIMNTPASKIRSAAMGLVEVSGLAAGPFTMAAPITGVPCYYYRTIAWKWQRQGKNSQWVKVADESFHLPFFLDDNTGRVLINPQGAEMEIHQDFKEEFSHSLFSSSPAIPPNVSGFLLRHGVPTDCKLKIEEYCIKPKNALFVLGTLAHNPGLTVSAQPVASVIAAQPKISISMPSLAGGLLFGGGVGQALTVGTTIYRAAQASSSAAPAGKPALDPAEQTKVANALTKAGVTSPQAWAIAGISQTPRPLSTTAAGAQAAAAAPAAEQFDPRPPTVLMKGEHNRSFFISWRSQREVVKSLGWKSAVMIWGGPVLTLTCVYILASHYGWW
jgi:E3 Ubiquitin ligase